MGKRSRAKGILLSPVLLNRGWADRKQWIWKTDSYVAIFHCGLTVCYTPYIHAAAAAKPLQSCPTLCNPRDGSPPGSAVPGILQARTLEWVAISFSNAWKWKVKSLSHVRLFTTLWTAAHQAPLSMGFSRQDYWSGLPLPSLLYPWSYWSHLIIFKKSL